MLKVALNPRNLEAVSYFDPLTGVNLFLSTPISGEVEGDLVNIVGALNSGTLIVTDGEIPEGINPPLFPEMRSRWPKQDEEGKDIEYPKNLTKKWDKFMEKLALSAVKK